MSRLALLCSGQGFLHTRLFALTAEAEAAAPIFAAAADVLGEDPRRLVGGDGVPHNNRTAQILCCTQALAAGAALGDSLGDGEVVVAGYSIGELVAWGVAGVFDAAATLRLAARRALVMDEAAAGTPGGLAAIRGLPRDRVEALCHAGGAHVAIVNGPDQIVIGGTRESLATVVDAAREAGAGKITELAVTVASHTPLMASAEAPLAAALHEAETRALPPGRRLLSGIDGESVFSLPSGLDKLSRQVCRTIDWQACMEGCVGAGATRALELGPGGALTALMAAHMDPKDCRSLDDFRTLDGVRRWIAAT